MKTLKQYIIELQEAGFPIGNIEAVKAEYRKKYAKLYKVNYAKSKKRLELTLSPDEYEKLKTAADESRTRIGSLAVRLIYAALQKTQLPLVREDVVRDAVVAIRRVGTLVNQWVRLSSQHQNLHLEHILACEKLLLQLEVQVVGILRQPRDLMKDLDKAIETTPQMIVPLCNVILQHISKQKDGDDRQ
jgi:uncharacterized protein (DUF1778 family)